jgi:hypothetical protein
MNNKEKNSGVSEICAMSVLGIVFFIAIIWIFSILF